MFRFFKTLFFVTLFVSIAAVAVLHLLLWKEGRPLVQSKLQQVFGKDVKVGSVRPLFPLDLLIEDVSVQGTGSCRRVIVRGGIIDVFSGNFVLSELVLQEPDIFLVKPQEQATLTEDELTAEDTVAVDAFEPVEPAEHEVAAVSASLDAAKPPAVAAHYVFVKKLVIHSGTIHICPEKNEANGTTVTIKNVAAQVRNLQFPVVSPVITSFTFSGEIPWINQPEKGKIDFKGWINLAEKDMRADLKIKDIDGLYFYSYFQDWLDLEKANIVKAKVNVDSAITGLKNDVTMDCHLSVTDLQFKQLEEGESEKREQRITSAIVDMFKAVDHGKISLDFKFRTKMDSPGFGFGVVRSAFETKISEVIKTESLKPGIVKTPVRFVGGTFGVVADLTRSVINGTLGIGKAISSSFQRSFDRRRDKEEKKEMEPAPPQ